MERYKKILYSIMAFASLNGLVLITQPAITHAVDVFSNVAKDPTDIPPRIARWHTKTVTVDLVAREVIAELTPGKKFWFWTFAEKKGDIIGPATVPGPMVRVMEGDTVVINLTNEEFNTPHNLDFHAGIGAMLMDVEPGETKTLKFKAMREGAYIYHCGAMGMPWEHVSHGMYGLIMVEPRGGLPKVAKEFYIGQSEWYLKPGIEEAPDVLDGYDLDVEKARAEHPDCFTFNGHTKALFDPSIYGPVTVDKKDTVRIFFVTGGPNIGANFHIIGQIFDKFYPTHYSALTRDEETAYIQAGSAAVVEFQALATGEFPIVDHALWRAEKGARGTLLVQEK
ncbi:MAG: multicopper oxidase domain-containing protein [Candidatus Brocadiaceae bacterium]